MVRKEKGGIPFFEFELFQEFCGGLRHAVFTRQTNINHATEIQKILQTDAPPLSFKNQLHGTQMHVVSLRAKVPACRQAGSNLEGDILITQRLRTPLIIRIADCASIMIFDPVKKAIANIHAGWRGLAKRAIHKTIEEFCARYGSQREDLLAGMSPMIGPCCYRFSDPRTELPNFFHRYITEENTVDLWAIAEEHLRECGILASHIENPRMCTACHLEDFFSYRREGDSKRFGTAIMLC